jgi:hypothetical protein
MPRFSHVIVVVLENRAFGDFPGKSNAPWINGTLMKRYAYATRVFVTTHNSPTAYYALASGKTYEGGDGGSWAGRCVTATKTCSTDDPSIFTQTRAAGRSWKVYSEDQVLGCQTSFTGKYWPNHNPAIFYRQLGPSPYWPTGDGTCAKWDVPAAQLPLDIARGALPALSYLIPNNCNNMHDNCTGDPIRQGDTWLRDVFSGNRVVVGGLAAWAEKHDTLVVITFDESVSSDTQFCCPYRASGGGGHIPLWILGPLSKVRGGGYHYDRDMNLFPIFKQLEENWSYPLLGRAADPTVGDLQPLLRPVAATGAAVGIAPNVAARGWRVRVAGHGFAPRRAVTLTLTCGASCKPVRLGALTTSATGALSGYVRIGRRLRPGRYVLVAADGVHAPARARVQVLGPPSVRRVVATGVVRVGATLRCGAAVSGAKMARFSWRRDGRLTRVRGRTYVVRRSDRGHRLGCSVSAWGKGGTTRVIGPTRAVSGAACVVPDLVGLSARAARERLRATACALGPERVRAGARGRVIAVAPGAGAAVRDGRQVTLVVGRG